MSPRILSSCERELLSRIFCILTALWLESIHARAEELLREIYEPIIRQNFRCPVHSDCPKIKDPFS